MSVEPLSQRPAATPWLQRATRSLARGAWRTKQAIKAPLYALYLRRLEAKAPAWAIPGHVGIVMDGNRRYARSRWLPSVSEGHRAGADRLHEVITWCHERGVRVVTVWALSLDNFKRDPAELAGLNALFEEKFREIVTHPNVHAKRVRVRYIGRRQQLEPGLGAAVREAEAATADYDGLVLNIALAYGGQEEIADALREHIREQAAAGLDAEAIADGLDPRAIDRHLYNAELPAPDLIIRTSGEVRLSGFLLWQSVYSEFYFCDAFWPEFRKIDFYRALREYSRRHRRFGR